MTQFNKVCLSMLQFSYKKKYESQSNVFTNKVGYLSSRFLNLLIMSSNDLLLNESAFHAGAILMQKVNFLTFVLLYSRYNLYSVFLVLSNFLGVKFFLIKL